MKKLLLVLALLSIVLVGCSKEEKRTPFGWALKYAQERYEEDYKGYNLIGFKYDEYSIYDLEDNDYEAYYNSAYQITFLNDSGKNVVYNAYIIYELKYDFIISQKYINKAQVIDVDLEEVYK